MPSDYGHEFADKELKKLESKLTKEYKQAAAEVEKKMKDFLSKFEEKDKKMLAKVQSGDMTAKEYAEWRKGQIMTGKRWEDMRDTLSQDLVNADKIAAGMINDSLPNAYAENMNFGTYEVESGVNIDTGFTLYDKNTVKNLMKKDPQIIPQARVDIPKDELWNRRKLTSAVMQGILQGESIPNIAKRLRSVADMDRNAAIRNARTYTTAAENKGRVDSYERANDMGIQVKQMWMATLDDRTRVEHRHLDGQVREIGEDFEADGYKIRYPGDPSAEPEMIYCCRCTLVADLPKYGQDLERNESKLGDMTYDEWKHAKDKPGKEGTTKQDAEIKAEKKEKNIDIPENVQKEISKFEDKFVDAKTEHYMTIDKDGNVIFESGKGGSRKVSVPKSVDEKMEGGYSIHNHPADATFSAADIRNYEKYGEHGIITDIDGYESVLFNTNPVAKFRETEKAETEEEYVKLMPFSVAAHEKFTEIDEEILKSRREYFKELMEKESDANIRTKLVNEWMEKHNPEEIKRKWLEENAEKYGFIYIRRKIGD